MKKQNEGCSCQGTNCGSPWSEVDRRDFMKASGIGAAVALTGRALPIMAGPFESQNEYLDCIPADKKLRPEWVRSLYERGEKEVYSDRSALAHIGMPVGGLFAGTLYLGGDGRLWLWDIFNRDQEGIQPRTVPYHRQQVPTRNGANYLEPATPESPFQLDFSLEVGSQRRPLDTTGFANVTFEGRYPIGLVRYDDPELPVQVTLTAFSPFIPLSADDSSLPATVVNYRVKNTGRDPIDVKLDGRIENPICLHSQPLTTGQRHNRVVRHHLLTAVECSSRPLADSSDAPREDILLEDFERAAYETWTATGSAFGTGPVAIQEIPDYQGDVQGEGQRVVNSHASAPGGNVGEKDGQVGTLTSEPFTIQRRFIRMLVGGGAHTGKTCVNLLVGGNVVASTTGRSDNRMQPVSLSVQAWEGKSAQLQIVDSVSGGWGNIGVDQIIMTDRPVSDRALEDQPDFGTVVLGLVNDGHTDDDLANASVGTSEQTTAGTLDQTLVGHVQRGVHLAPGDEAEVSFLVAWHFPNFYGRGVGGRRVGHHYASRFNSALAVADYLAHNFQRLSETTKKWVDTWYDSTLPFWLLDRTMANTSTLATCTCYRFADGRFWAWEGIGCCEGTCTHVWHYAQAPGRLFPEIERIERERVNYGIGYSADGGIGHRTSLDRAHHPATDGQCGRILGMLREHQMSPDDQFLKRLWPKVKQSVEFLIRHDGNADGILEGSQPNTLDAAWYGKISFVSSLYIAALRAAEAMARDMDDVTFADKCHTIAAQGSRNISQLFNGEYFIQIEDPNHANAIGVGDGCYIDQVFGQTWAHWVGLGNLFNRDEQLSALRSLWKYNFVPDVGPFREHFKLGRWYATAGDAGLVMCTWPKGGQREDWKKHWQYGYFNECMSGFEWQAAAHMVWEGIDQEDVLQAGLAISRAIHDRYNAQLRNPYNEVECSDHYARAMASYGVFQAVCGFQHHGPQGMIEFDPRLSPDDFRAAFTAAEGWGTYSQRRTAHSLAASLLLRHGTLRLTSLIVNPKIAGDQIEVTAKLNGQPVPASASRDGDRIVVAFEKPVHLQDADELVVELT